MTNPADAQTSPPISLTKQHLEAPAESTHDEAGRCTDAKGQGKSKNNGKSKNKGKKRKATKHRLTEAAAYTGLGLLVLIEPWVLLFLVPVILFMMWK
ncbi:hypothetical protein OG948_52295 (plasmid) [Embleya sp. NBC_00888]|uniref:hypothetical protein n=1 Tax=Embleya sp. NBC_00888 TaxID=2975960 RepID=UPI002F90D84E|nr:hypothetical protein OG948_52295 [Embleya sp. NBC_00888]